MRCPTLTELPPLPPGKAGWPWTEESPQLPDNVPDPSTGSGHAAPWPRISIVTPSYNQGQFIEETIRSVLLQGYPNLEYIIIDGGSTDGSVDIIRKYEPWLAYWVSEPDRGQSHAINKGLLRTSGDVIAYLNSDDIYLRDVLAHVSQEYAHNPFDLIAYDCHYIDADGHTFHVTRHCTNSLLDLLDLSRYDRSEGVTQPGVFWSRRVLDTCGLFREDLHRSMDYEYWVRATSAGFSMRHLAIEAACNRFHQDAKSAGKMTLLLEDAAVAEEYVRTLKDDIPEGDLEQIEKSIPWCRTEAMFCGAREAAFSGNKLAAMHRWLVGFGRDFPANMLRRSTFGWLKLVLKLLYRKSDRGKSW